MSSWLPKVVVGLRAKVQNDSGETIAETLVSILISALALLLLATAIGTSANIVKSSRDKMDAMYAEESQLVSASLVSASVDVGQDSQGQSSTVQVDVPLTTPADVGGSPDENGFPEDVMVFTRDVPGDQTIGVYRRLP